MGSVRRLTLASHTMKKASPRSTLRREKLSRRPALWLASCSKRTTETRNSNPQPLTALGSLGPSFEFGSHHFPDQEHGKHLGNGRRGGGKAPYKPHKAPAQNVQPCGPRTSPGAPPRHGPDHDAAPNQSPAPQLPWRFRNFRRCHRKICLRGLPTACKGQSEPHGERRRIAGAAASHG